LLPTLAGLGATIFPFGFATSIKAEVEFGVGAGETVPDMIIVSEP